jgi:hypothetical protein
MHLHFAYHRIMRNPFCMHACAECTGSFRRSVLSFIMRCPEPILLQSTSKTRINTIYQLPNPSLISSQATVLASKAADRVVHHPTPCADAMAKALSRGCGDLGA